MEGIVLVVRHTRFTFYKKNFMRISRLPKIRTKLEQVEADIAATALILNMDYAIYFFTRTI